MIPKTAFFFWSKGTKLSYLRYLTLVSFRKHHPNWKVYICHPEQGNYLNWSGPEKQDFLDKAETPEIDYIEKCKDLDVTFVNYKKHSDKAPVHVADFFRWDALYNNGGWFFDLDQIFVKSFDDLCQYDFVFDGSDNFYIGVIGMSKGCEIGRYVYKNMYNAYNPNYYCCTGPWYMRALLKYPCDKTFKEIESKYKTFYAPINYFYPLNSSDDVSKLYNDNIEIDTSAYAIHWFGGHPESQKYNKLVTSDNALTFDNTITKHIQKNI